MTRICFKLAFVALVMSLAMNVFGDAGNVGPWGDQGDGTYKNPVLPGDYPDLDVIRVGPDYYAITSTDHFSPGVAVLHSKDLVNWQIIGHVVDDLKRVSPEMNFDKMNARSGRGIWAGAIRYHDGKFWVYFFAPEDGLFVSTAKDPAGPWEPVSAVWTTTGWDDCCPFWDDDGQGYLVATNVAQGYEVHVFRMSPDSKNLLLGSDKIIRQSKGAEGNKLYKINGLYYHFFSEFHGDDRVMMMERAKNVFGPYDVKQINHVNQTADREPNQGGLVQAESGQWWMLSHQGTMGWEGRPAALLPVTWVDGWPIPGKVGLDGQGAMVWSAKKPVDGAAVVVPQTDDEFNGKTLGPQWEWNFEPRNDKWSLTEQAGFLRLYATRPLAPGGLLKAANTLTQRSMRTAKNEAVVKLDISNMTNGQQAGLCHLSNNPASLGISQAGNLRTLTYTDTGKISAGPVVVANTVWLKSTWDEAGAHQFLYSLDGSTFTEFDKPYSLGTGDYRGDRIGIYSYNTDADTGYVDVDWFHYSFTGPQSGKTTLMTQP
ncbi:MAG: glycoside hydrolase 43 family protein [Planctomycetota bacterium]|nr:glycoside hydrolase 43 family protein [Planctomycetota bacterium]